MCIYTVKKKKKKKKKHSSRGVRNSTECPKTGVSVVKDTAKTDKDIFLSVYMHIFEI